MTFPSLLARVASTIHERKLLKPGDTVIVALSGGADSCALLDLLAALPDFSLRLTAAHLNHCLRGTDSDADETFCRLVAKRYNIPFESRRTDVAEYAAKHRLSLEDAGRQARGAFFRELMEGRNADALALGHHRDDQAETFLMSLLRGAGGQGLSGMSFSNERCHIRPLLDITRSEIEAWLRGHNLPWREDASNRDTTFLRNRIRHELLPVLETFNPAIRERLAATADILREDNHLLSTVAQGEYDRLAHGQGVSVDFEVSSLKVLHPALLNRVIRIALSRITGNLLNISRLHIAHIAALLADGSPNRSLDLPGSLTARREYDHISFVSAVPMPETPPHVVIHAPGTFQLWDGMSLHVSSADYPEHLDRTPPETAYLDLDSAPFPWHVRTFMPGDRMLPLGMTGSKKVKEIFIDQKISARQRQRVPLVFSGETLTWVCGLRFSACAAISPASSRIARAVLKRPDES